MVNQWQKLMLTYTPLLTTLEVLRQYLKGRQATVLGNQFLYYAQGFPKLRVAPDVMVIFDVEPGDGQLQNLVRRSSASRNF